MSDNLGARLRNAKESLAAWYERLNAQWADAEKTLRSLNLSQNVWTSFKGESWESDGGTPANDVFSPIYTRDFEHCLAFLKQDGEWRICYSFGEADGDPDSHSPRPILDCSLEIRTLALEGLPKLLQAIVREAEAESGKLEAALGAAAESLASFKAAMR
ncbi:MAG TPA: hypothetical protein VMV10_25640 [Pirellulales bacterium]|nr:hypothetical protein [Pirellulales bacterium]